MDVQIRPVDPESFLLAKEDPVPHSYIWLKANENCGEGEGKGRVDRR